MQNEIISSSDILAEIIHSNYQVLVVLERLGIQLGFGNKSVSKVAEENNIDVTAFLLILNLFCNKNYMPKVENQFNAIPDILVYLKNSHAYFLVDKIPSIQNNIKKLVHILGDSKSELVESFYNNYIEEVTEHIEYENKTVFPYIEMVYQQYKANPNVVLKGENYGINIYGEHHDDIEDELKDLKNILIRHLPQVEDGKVRRKVLQQLFELESDLFSHGRIEDEVLIPLVKNLENNLSKLMLN
ncbi:MAG: hemerythrin domain-containing protein [Bacteroidota bacterium]